MAAPIYRGGRPFIKPGIRVGNNHGLFTISGAPVDGTSGSFAAKAGPGSILMSTNGSIYVNINTKASPTWAELAGSVASTITPTEAVALTAAQSGSVVFLNAAAGFAITLPALAAGVNFRFVTGAAFATTNFTIVSAGSANIIEGGAIVNSVFVPAVNEDSINFVATAETVGDYVDVVSDGTSWLVSGVGAQAGSITFTAA